MKATNPEKPQDRVFDLADHFDQFGDVMFHQQRTIYENLRDHIEYETILEAGCGNGVGAGILSRKHTVTVTDVSRRNLDFSTRLYPWLSSFGPWDIKDKSPLVKEVVVAVEVFEHVSSPETVLENLLDAASRAVYFTTPNGRGKKNPPDNPYHVYEYAPEEIVELLSLPHLNKKFKQLNIRHWDTWEVLPITTEVNPLVYELRK